MTRPPAARRRGAFTLIEMLAVVLLVSIVLTQAVAFYFDLSRAGMAASERVGGARRAASIVDRVGRDIERAFLVAKPAETDPLDHPWLFVAESAGERGARRLRFVMRLEARASDSTLADVGIVTYDLRETEDGDYALWRRVEPGLPPGLERRIEPDDGDLLLAEGLRGFGVRFRADDGTWRDDWDSTQIVESALLPVAAEIALDLPRPADTEDFPLDDAPDLVRRVAIPMRPLDLDVLLAAAPEAEDAPPDCAVTVEVCFDENARFLLELGLDDAAIQDRIAAGACLEDEFIDSDGDGRDDGASLESRVAQAEACLP